MTVFEILLLRSQWEEIVSYHKVYDLPDYNGTIDNLYAFIENGAKKNRFRKKFDTAIDIAKQIVSYHETTNISGVSRKKV